MTLAMLDLAELYESVWAAALNNQHYHMQYVTAFYDGIVCVLCAHQMSISLKC